MKWKRIEAGEYYSEDERFHILDTWDRISGKYWSLYDSNTKQEIRGYSLKHVKKIAEDILEMETK